MDQLTLNYMEMCNMESSTGSDSEISPRWSDTSTMGCVSSAPESGASWQALPLTHKPAGRRGCYSLCLDPYDGSSEDSDGSTINASVSSRQTKQQAKGGGKAGCRLLGQTRRFIFHHSASVALREGVQNEKRNCLREQQNLLDIQMKCGSDSDRCACELDTLPSHSDRDACKTLSEERGTDSMTHTQTMDMELQLDDSGLHITGSSTLHPPKPQTSVEGSSSQMLGCSSERSSCLCNFGSLHKRKLNLPGVEVVELGQRKKQCVSNMKEEGNKRFCI
ncbi:uncharacterized protein LOC115773047 isoform X2 [Archocentrus centrarchus]|nr:uncharacterized protein LOC115773047 isoform X2 [Archocentrus centrarchus]